MNRGIGRFRPVRRTTASVCSWFDPIAVPQQVAERLRPLLELPVEDVLAAHGGPTDRASLERALA